MICSLLALFSLFSPAMAAARERTFLMLKPDAVQRGLVGKIIQRFEEKGFKLVAMKYMWASEELLKQHYADLATYPFFPSLIKYMNSGPVVPMVCIIASFLIQFKQSGSRNPLRHFIHSENQFF
ncbi:Hypothetical predicted protein [Cloeon dipterum]|uniref:nucleoside-diphosphate kinase n=1 Tax=Cloeon dipterum TaxID=197152 RepID=A0A8S1DRU5_9INSE|nr:Hypothetical predicted protein [Cloeon dipterum]